MIVSMRSVGDKEVARELIVGSVKIAGVVYTVVQTYGQLLKTRIQANASGRPGPNAPTGDYRRSWTVAFAGNSLLGNAEAVVGTNAVQGRRLEYGFVGADSLGRVYNQPPFPHVGPAADAIEPLFYAALDAGVIAALGG